MLFWMFLVGCFAALALPVLLFLLTFDEEAAAVGFGVGLLVSMLSLLAVYEAWSGHASDISRVVAQEHRIEVYQERIESIDARLSNAEFPRKPGISVDADSPWASMIEALAQAESELAKAKDERAIAIRSIEARKRGPMSGVVSFVGDYEVD
jgi:hypothetical protein